MGTRQARRRPTRLITGLTTGLIARLAGVDGVTILLAVVVVALLTIGGSGRAPSSEATPPPPGRFAHGAAGTARNGFGGSVAPSPTIESWPGTGAGRNGGPFAFIGAQYGSLWSIPPGANNSIGVGYCVMEDVGGEGTVALQPDPATWDAGEMARAAALMTTFGGDRVVPYGIDASGGYDVVTGEWHQPSLLGGGEYTRRRQVAVNFGVKIFLEDVSPSGAAAGRKLARDTAIVNGSGGEFAALRNGYAMAQRMVTVAERQHAVGGVTLQMTWRTPDGAAPAAAGSYPLEVRATDSTGKPVGFVPVVQLSEIGIDANRSVGAVAIVNSSRDTADDAARWNAAEQNGWPTLDMGARLTMDPRFSVGWNPQAADVTDETGIARFDVSIAGPYWELAFHTQAPTANVDLYAGSGVQGQVTWTGPPQSASAHQVMTPPPAPPPAEPDGEFVVRKVIDASDIQGDRDMSGFVFEVRPDRDGSGTATTGTATTGADGRTPPITATAGEYTIVEVARPSWATGLTDGGPVTFRFDPLAGPGPLEITYRNVVPPVTIATTARDAADGDKYLTLPDDRPAAIIDTLTYTGLVPGTSYVARGTLMTKNARCDEWCLTPFVRTPFVTSTAFVPAEASGTIDVRFEIPAFTTDLRGATVVVFQRIEVERSGRVVAEHADPTDLDQTVHVPALTSMFRGAGADPRTLQVGDEVVDVVDYAGLDVGVRYRMELTLNERRADGTCTPLDGTEIAGPEAPRSSRTSERPAPTSSVEFVTTAAAGTVDVGPVTIPGPGTFVAFERLLVDGRVIASHEDCNDRAQTVQVPAPDAPPTTAPPTTAPPTTTPPTTAPRAVTTSPVEPAPPALPRTGGNGPLALAGLALVMMGAGLVLTTRRRSSRERLARDRSNVAAE